MKLVECLDKLLYFNAIYETGSVHAAARKLHIAQPSVSYALKFLEDVLETKLFYRDRKGMRPTETGAELKRYSDKIFKLAESADHAVREPEDPLSGTLRVGTYDIFAVHLLPIVMAKFQKALPQLKIELLINNSNRKLMQALDSGEIHLSVMASPKATSGIVVKNIYQESFAFFSAEKVTQACTQEWLKQKSLIVFGQAIATARKTIVEVLEQLELGDCIRHNLSSFDAVLSFARKDLGVALAPLVLTENIIRPTDIQRIRIKGVKEKEFGSQHVGIVCSRHYVADPKVVAFTQSLLHLREL